MKLPVLFLGHGSPMNAVRDTAYSRNWRLLAPLRSKGVLIVASGDIVHNLSLTDRRAPDEAGEGYPWAESARSLVNRWLENGNTAALANEAAYPEELHLAAPTPEHWWPLLYAAGAADENGPVQIFNDDIVGKSLSMTSVVFGSRDLLPAA